ncbi:molecular chaperone [Atlantibacter sp.]|uniref:fimbrial biogenesis chaperone n=1 Tax=Atlantibacter sp. TaxID=1903473 RepID=UPI0028AEC3B1|nr:molecular chaperone [Atlantibacter sp.]
MNPGRGLLLWGLLLTSFTSLASVVMTGNRVIYPSSAREVSVQLTNQDAFPNVVQAWVDEGNESSTPQSARAPFMLTPPMFRLAPHSGHTLRLRYTGTAGATDRESLYWLNILQIPPSETNQTKNQLLVVLKTRVKVLVRPASLKGNPAKMEASTRIWLEDQGQKRFLNLHNDSGYYLALSSLNLAGPASKAQLVSRTVAPFETLRVPVTLNRIAPDATMTWINDQGAVVTRPVTAARQAD